MFCKFCGNNIDNDSVFCKICGKNQNEIIENNNEHKNKDINKDTSDSNNFNTKTNLISDTEKKVFTPTKHCQSCGKALLTNSINPLCSNCYSLYHPTKKDYPPKKKLNPAIIIIVVIVIIIIIYALVSSNSYSSTDYNTESSSTNYNSFPEVSEYEIQLNEAYITVSNNANSIVKEKVKNKDTVVCTGDKSKFTVNKSKLNYFGDVKYTNAKGVEVVEPLEICIVATDKFYNCLYLKMGNNVLYDFRNFFDDYGNYTEEGAAASNKPVGSSIFGESDGEVFCVNAEPETSSKNSTSTSQGKSKENDNLITYEKYISINNGMTYEEVCDIVGSYGKELSNVEFGGYKTIIVMWYGKGSTGSNANVTFQNGKVIAKAQFGLE